MLVLSRKLGEKIFIGDTICITVVDIDRGKIRLGIDAPKDVPIAREELLRFDDPRRGCGRSAPTRQSDYCSGCGGRVGSSCDCHPPGPLPLDVELSGR
jgi:carbon storage regulator